MKKLARILDLDYYVCRSSEFKKNTTGYGCELTHYIFHGIGSIIWTAEFYEDIN